MHLGFKFEFLRFVSCYQLPVVYIIALDHKFENCIFMMFLCARTIFKLIGAIKPRDSAAADKVKPT